ncbi:hypothetical protein GGR56DRAFT_2242 [Xylariaceae sp. FL0804]|nr:hypothetical protein GGR56DRAFT_2242 [Xylariaceae sp. FL0804]
MSSYYSYNHHQPTAAGPSISHSHHGGRNRRAPRLSVSQNSHKQFRGVRSMKELSESPSVSAFRTQFEASRSFDLEDDMEFCPKLLTETDLVSISSASSDRSSLSSNSPSSSPTQHPQHVAPAFSLNSTSPAFVPPTYQSQQAGGLSIRDGAGVLLGDGVGVLLGERGFYKGNIRVTENLITKQWNLGAGNAAVFFFFSHKLTA